MIHSPDRCNNPGKRFILKALRVENKTHIPGAYYTSLTARNAITYYFKHVPR